MANTKDKDASAGNTKSFNFAVAKQVLSDTEKDRCLCLFLNSDHKTIDWAKATADFNCASVESMRVMTRSTLKKITDAEKNGGVAPASKASASGKKRKAAVEDDEEAPAPKVKKAKGKKKADTPVDEDRDEVKKEGEEVEMPF